MNSKLEKLAALVCASACALSVTACDGEKDTDGFDTLLGSPKTVERVHYTEVDSDEYKDFKSCVENFSADFAACAYSAYEKNDNFAVSPISVFMALALSSECAAGDTRTEILDAMGVTYDRLKTQFPVLYRTLEAEHKEDDVTTSLANLTNSVWVNKGTSVKSPCIEALSNDFYAYSYSVDFENDNAVANKGVSDFVNKQTKGLIDKDFEFSTETIFTLINTLYLSAVWNTSGEDLPFAKDGYDFTAKDGSVKNVRLLQGYYTTGRAAEFDTYTTFYTRTYDGYKIKFILPKDGYTVDGVFTAENIAAVNSITNYNGYDEAENVHYLTRVLFPEYECEYDENIVGILRDGFGIDLLFKDSMNNAKACDFSTLSDDPCYCNKVRHMTNLTVDRKGIEGAAVTAIELAGSGEPVTTVEEDFIVDKAFGFIITDYLDTTLFSGVVNYV